jgi:hypothetical protein
MMGLLLSTLPEGFPESIRQTHYFLRALSGPVAIWIVRILAVLIFAGVIGWWIYLEYKNRPGDK